MRNRIGGVVLLAFAALAFAAPLARAADRPNILLIYCDDHAYQAIGAYGQHLNPTPHIDRLANEGMLFRQCLVTNSLCGPARAVVQTGKYSHLNGYYGNEFGEKFDNAQQTFPKLLQKAGYQTALIGKWHLDCTPTGYDYWDVLVGQGIYYNPLFINNGKHEKDAGYVTDIITKKTLDWLEHKRDPNKPFLLMCQHKAPHRPWDPGPRHVHDFDHTTFPEPPTLLDNYGGRGPAERGQDMTIAHTLRLGRDLKIGGAPRGMTPEQQRAWDSEYGPRAEEFRRLNLTGDALTRWKYQKYMQDYLRCIASVDDSVGEILDYLDKSGLAKNTVVVYSSDQGFFLGEHGWFDKRWIYDQSLRTPLLVRWPGHVKPASESDAIVSNLDFAETFLDIAGAKVPADMQGRSFVPVLEGHTPADWRTGFYYHYYEYPAWHMVAAHYGIVTKDYKLFYFPMYGYWELFDRNKDPHELTSVYARPRYAPVVQRLTAELHGLQQQYKDTDPNTVPPPIADFMKHHPQRWTQIMR